MNTWTDRVHRTGGEGYMMRRTREVAASNYVGSRKLEPPMYLREKF